jgi:hypothetical protein
VSLVRVVEFPDEALVPIVSDGAIATVSLGEGRLIPVLIIDCSDRPKVLELILAHEHLPPGDVKVTWATKRFKKSTIYLHLQFERPAQLDVLLPFDAGKNGILVDGILHSRGVYLQPKESAPRVSQGLDKPKILVEVPDTGFMPIWNPIFADAVAKRMRQAGASRRAAHELSAEHILKMRELWSKRVGFGRPHN